MYEFEEYRNHIGGLLLVPRGFNQSYGDLPYKKKLPHDRSTIDLCTLSPTSRGKADEYRSIVMKLYEEGKTQKGVGGGA